MAHGDDPQIPESGQIFVPQQTNLASFYNNNQSNLQLDSGASADSRADEFKDKKVLSSFSPTTKRNNLDKIKDRDSGRLKEQYSKFSMRSDSPQTGWFKEPFIMRGIQRNNNKRPSTWGSFGISPFIKRGGEIFGQPNGLVRGGISAVERSLVDGLRIGKFLLGGPRGLLFIAQQIGLQLTAPRLETQPGVEGPLLERATRVYNPATTLLQVAGNAAGVHLTRHGLLSNLTPTGIQRYKDVVGRRNELSADAYRNSFNIIGRRIQRNKDLTYKNSYNRLLNMTSDAFYNTVPTRHVTVGGKWPFLSAKAGPNSLYGLGKPTNHIRTEVTDAAVVPNPSVPIQNYVGMSVFSREQAISDHETHKLIDFRVYKTGKDLLVPGYSEKDTYRNGIDNEDITLARKYGFYKNPTNISDVKLTADGKTYFPESFGADTIDEIGIVNSDRSGDKVDNFLLADVAQMDDLVDLIFKDVDGLSNRMQFRCAMEAITDTFTPQWDETTYMGRAEPVFHYKGADARKISTGFTAYAVNRKSLKSMYQKLNRLAGYTMPKYVSSNFNQMTAPLMQLTIGDYIVNQPGFLSSLTYNIEQDTYWETTRIKDNQGNTLTYIVPRVIKVDFEYTVIEKDLVQRYKYNFGTTKWLDRV